MAQIDSTDLCRSLSEGDSSNDLLTRNGPQTTALSSSEPRVATKNLRKPVASSRSQYYFSKRRRKRKCGALPVRYWIAIGLLVLVLVCVALGLLIYFVIPRQSAAQKGADCKNFNAYMQQSAHDAGSNELILPRSVQPEHYWIKLQPFLALSNATNLTVVGSARIRVTALENASVIVLHAFNVQIHSAQQIRIANLLTPYDYLTTEGLVWNNKSQTVAIVLHESLRVGQTYDILFDEFSTQIQLNGKGLYLSSYRNKRKERRYLAATQFEVANARNVFPCFDEPAFKANFSLTIVRRENMRSLSNMPRVRTIKRGDGWMVDEYEPSVKMSTYLVAFVIHDFDYKNISSKRGVQIRAYARGEAKNDVDHSLNIAAKILDYFESYFNIPYQLSKIDLIALPDFSHGAMENWGLLTFKETTLLYKPGRDSRYRRQTVSMIVGHEIAHQWFGNLVTMKWWTDLWLNEGFAHYMGYVSAEAVDVDEPMDQAYIFENVVIAMKMDALESTHPVVTEVYDPVEILQLFDIITYRKGSCLIRMMAHFLGEETFQKGLQLYLRNNSYSNAVSQDLWRAFDEVASKSTFARSRMGDYKVGEVMENWVQQSGYPVVHLSRNPNGKLTISQTKFSILMRSDKNEKQCWLIPFTFYVDAQHQNWNQTPIIWLKSEPITLKETFANGSWYVANVDYMGFYRVNYDQYNWEMLGKQLLSNHKMVRTAQRAQILDDSFELARAEIIDFRLALNMTVYLTEEREYLPWVVAFQNFRYLDDLMQDDGYEYFKLYMQKLLTSIYERIGWLSLAVGENKYTEYLRQHVVTQACYYQVENCLNVTESMYKQWMKTQSIRHIPVTLRQVVLCTGIKEGNESEWRFAWQQYLTADSSSERKTLLQSLACTKNVTLLNELFAAALNSSLVRQWDIPDIMSSLSVHAFGRKMGWKFIKDNWAALNTKLDEIAGKLVDIVVYFNTPQDLGDVVDFIGSRPMETSERKFLEAVETIKMNVNVKSKNIAKLVEWFRSMST